MILKIQRMRNNQTGESNAMKVKGLRWDSQSSMLGPKEERAIDVLELEELKDEWEYSN